MVWAIFWAIFSQTHLVTNDYLPLRKKEKNTYKENLDRIMTMSTWVHFPFIYLFLFSQLSFY
jgi:hypothetical protein